MTPSRQRRTDMTEPNSATARRRDVETMLDDMLAESFPASDPPTWDAAADRIEKLDAPGAS